MKSPNVLFDHIGSLVLVAGVSGAGRSVAVDSLSDLGYYTVENLPVPLLPAFAEMTARSPGRYIKTALCLDIDSREKQEQLMAMLKTGRLLPENIRIIFLDCTTDVIVKRYGQTRRPHPGFDPNKDKTLEDAIQREKKRLFAVRELASLVIDTTEMNVHDLWREIRGFIEDTALQPKKAMRVNFLSFGFKHGVPIDCDLVVDVRFLPNPFFVEALKDKSGMEPQVSEYVMRAPGAIDLVSRYAQLLEFLLPQYVQSGRTYLNVGVGCTGGRHRSVAICEQLADVIREKVSSEQYITSVKHRDLEKIG